MPFPYDFIIAYSNQMTTLLRAAELRCFQKGHINHPQNCQPNSECTISIISFETQKHNTAWVSGEKNPLIYKLIFEMKFKFSVWIHLHMNTLSVLVTFPDFHLQATGDLCFARPVSAVMRNSHSEPDWPFLQQIACGQKAVRKNKPGFAT